MREPIDPEISEARATLTEIFYKNNPDVYKLLFPLISEIYIEIEKNKRFRGSEISNLEFFIKGTLGLILDLYDLKYIASLKNKYFALSDIDAVLLFNVNTTKYLHLENIMKSIFQRLFYKHRFLLETNKKFIQYMYEIEKNFKPTGNIKSIKKIKLLDTIKYKKKNFESRWKRDFDDKKHNIRLRINEDISGKEFFLYRLWAPFSVLLKSGRFIKIDIELVDVSLQRVSDISMIPSNAISKDLEKLRRSILLSNEKDVMRTVEEIRRSYKKYDINEEVYDLHLEMWHRIKDTTKGYIKTILFDSLLLPITSLKYQLLENMLILINDPGDPKTDKRLNKIKFLFSYLFPDKSFKESRLEL